MQQLKHDGFHVDELFQKCLFEGDEKETVLRAIRIVQPDYQLPPAPKPQSCKSALLSNFYSKVSRQVGGGDVGAGQTVPARPQGAVGSSSGLRHGKNFAA